MFKIEKGVPIPPRPGRRRAACPYPLEDLAVGDSFAIPLRGDETPQRITDLLWRWGRRLAISVVVRTIDDGRVVRVWRVHSKAPLSGATALVRKPATYVHRLSDEEPAKKNRKAAA